MPLKIKVQQYRYALYSDQPYPIGTIASRYISQDGCEMALEKIRPYTSDSYICLPIDHPKIQAHYKQINEMRRKQGLKPISPWV